MSAQIAQPAVLLAAALRILAALSVMPIFSHRSFPLLLRIALSGLCAWVLVVPGKMPVQAPASLGAALLGLGGETLLGLLLGFSASLAFWTLTTAGELIGQEMGWGMAAMLHMSWENASAPTGQFFNVLGSLVFLGIGGHRMTLMALANTFDAAPPFTLSLAALNADYVLGLGSSLLSGAFQLALPVIGTIMLMDALLAFLSRALPQLNAWIFGVPLKIGAGLFAMWLSLPLVLVLLERWLTKAIANLPAVVR